MQKDDISSIRILNSQPDDTDLSMINRSQIAYDEQDDDRVNLESQEDATYITIENEANNRSKVVPIPQLRNSRLNRLNELKSNLGASERTPFVSFNQAQLRDQKSAKKMLKMMSYNVPLDQLYEIKSTCCFNELNKYCPILVEITNPELQNLYNGTHLIQVWNKEGELLFERTRNKTLECLSLVGNFFVFKKILEEHMTSVYSKYEIIKLQPNKVQLICEVEIHKDHNTDIDEDIAVSIIENTLIIANETEIKYKDLSNYLQAYQDSAKCKLDLKLSLKHSEFKRVSLNQPKASWRIIGMNELARQSEGQEKNEPGCMLVCENTDEGQLKFFQVLTDGEGLVLQSLAPKAGEIVKPSMSKVVKYCTVMSYVDHLMETKQFAVALKEDFSVDLYYDFILVETLRSDAQFVYYAIDLSFKELFLFSIDLQTKNIRKTDINLMWLQKIGLTSGAEIKQKSLEDLREDYYMLVSGLEQRPTLFSPSDTALMNRLSKRLTSPEVVLMGRLAKKFTRSKSKRVVWTQDQAQEIIKLAMIFFVKKQEGIQSICTNYVKLYSQFVNTNTKIFVSHNRFISSFNLRNEKWSKNHVQLGDSVTRLVQIGKLDGDPDEIKIGVFVGYQYIHFMEYSERIYDYVLLDAKLVTEYPIKEVYFDSHNEVVCYFICLKANNSPQSMVNHIDPKTRVLNPLPVFSKETTFTIQALFEDKIIPIVTAADTQDPAFQVIQKPFKLCIRKTFGDFTKDHHELVIDSIGDDEIPHVQAVINLKFNQGQVVKESTSKFEIDYSDVDVKRAGKIVGQIVYADRICQFTLNHILIMRVDQQIMKVQRVILNRNLQIMEYLGNDWIYCQTTFFQQYDNENDGPFGPVLPRGLYVMNFKLLMDEGIVSGEKMDVGPQRLGKVGSYQLDETLSGQNSYISYNPQTLQLAYIQDFNILKVSPLANQDNLRFFGMSKKSEYLIWREYKDTFTAVHQSSKITMWNTITGKVLQQGTKADFGSQAQRLSSVVSLRSEGSAERGCSTLDFKVYKANKEDKTWLTNYYRKKTSSISLIVSKTPAKKQQPDSEDTGGQENPFQHNEIHLRDDEHPFEMKLYDFKVLELRNEVVSQKDHEFSQNGSSLYVKFGAIDDDEAPVEHFSWFVKMQFTLRIPVEKQERPYMYISEDERKLMVHYPDTFNPVIYSLNSTNRDIEVFCVPLRRIQGFPMQLKGQCCYNFLFSPNFEKFLDFDYEANQIIIRQTQDGRVLMRISEQVLNLELIGKVKSINNIPFIGARVMFHSETEIRMLNQDCIDIIFSIDKQVLKIKSFVALDNFKLHRKSDRHVFLQPKVYRLDQSLKRLIQKNSRFKLFRQHDYNFQKQLLEQKGKLDKQELDKRCIENSEEQIFSVEFNYKGDFYLNLNFNVLDWIVAEEIWQEQTVPLDQIEGQQVVQMCFNVFPRCKSILHFLTENKALSNKEQHLREIFAQANLGKFNKGQRLTIPILRDSQGNTPLDICLDSRIMNLNLADQLFTHIKDYPLLHSSFLLYSAVVKAIEHELPSIGSFMDARLIESIELRSDNEFSQVCIAKQNQILDKTVSYREFSICENKATIRNEMFTKDGFVRPLSLCYFDIPSINDRSSKSNAIFEALSETEDLKIFNSLSVNIILEKAWQEHRTVFIVFFVVPYCLLLGTFFFWSNYCSFHKPERAGFKSEEAQKQAGIVSFFIIVITGMYFLLQEVYQFISFPKLYFTSSWNFSDILAMCLCLVSPIHYMLNIHHCRNVDTCEDGIPNGQSKRRLTTIWYIQTFATLIMWFKLLYYLRMFTNTGYLVRSIIKIIEDMGSFMLMYIIAIFAFSQAWYVVSNYHEKYIPDTEDAIYANYWGAWTLTWQTMLAIAGEIDVNGSPLAFIIHISQILIIYLTMLNMLIASIGSSYDQVNETRNENSMRERAELISDVRSFPMTRYFTRDRDPETFLFVAMHKQDKTNQTDQLQE